MLKRALILTLMLFAFVTPTFAQNNKIEQQKKVIANLEKRIAQEEKQLAQLKQNKASIEQQIESLSLQIEERNKLIDETTEQIKQLTEEVKASELRLKHLGGQIKELEANAEEIIRVAYRNYRIQNELTYLFSAKSFSDFAQRIATLRVATKYRYTQIEEVTEVRNNEQKERDLLTQRRNELSNTKKKLNEQRVKLQANVAEAKKEVNKLSEKQKATLRSKIAHESELNKAIAVLRKLSKGNKTGSSFSKKLRGLKLPVENGKVKQFKNNLAEITGPKDAAVNSIYEGKVMDITRNKVDNKYIVYIAHGEYLSSYANLSEVTVEKGAIVKKGARIGTIGLSINKLTMEMEYKIVFGIYSPSPSEVMSAENCFKK